MAKNYSHKDLRNAAFVKKDLSGASFSNSDLRGAKFSGSNLLGADFSHVITGLTPANIIWIFFHRPYYLRPLGLYRYALWTHDPGDVEFS